MEGGAQQMEYLTHRLDRLAGRVAGDEQIETLVDKVKQQKPTTNSNDWEVLK